MQFSHKDLKKLVMSEVSVNRAKYKNFYSGSLDNMLTSLERYITYGVYSQEVVDIAVLATVKVLCVSMCIYKEQNGKALLITQTSDPPSTHDVYLKYDKEHYDAICSMTPGKRNAIETKPLNKNEIPSLLSVVDNDIPLECGFTQNQINAFALQGTFFEAYTPQGEKYLVMLTNLPNDHPVIQDIFKSTKVQQNWNSQINYIQPPVKQFFKPSNVFIQQNETPSRSENISNTNSFRRNQFCNLSLRGKKLISQLLRIKVQTVTASIVMSIHPQRMFSCP